MQINEVIFYKNISEYYKSHILIGKKKFLYVSTYLSTPLIYVRKEFNELPETLREKLWEDTHLLDTFQ